MQSILILTDFSDASLHAARYAAMLAKKLQSKRLVLFHAWQSIPAVSNQPMIAAGGIDLHTDRLETMEKWKQLVRSFTDPSTAISFFVDEIDLVKGSNAICDQEKIDLVVMGITGKSNLEKVLIGSNAIKVMQGIDFPLVIVPKDAPCTIPEKIVLATDLKEVEEKISIPPLTLFLQSLGAKLLVVNVADQEQPASRLTMEISALHHTLDKFEPEFHYITDKDTIAAIDLFAVEQNAELIVTIHQQKSGLSALFHKSISKKLAWHSRIPLLVLPF